MRRRVCSVMYSLFAACVSLFVSDLMVGAAQASDPRIIFELTDEPGAWFKNTAGPVAGFKSLAVATPGTEVRFKGNSNTVHTRTSLIFPAGAINMPFDTPPRKGSDEVVLHTPGLYVFTCKIHPYMFGAVIVDDPTTTEGLDLGKKIRLVNGIEVPTYSDLALRLLRTFFIATNPGNWKDYTKASWAPSYPEVPVIVYNNAGTKIPVGNLAPALKAYDPAVNPQTELGSPSVSAVGEIWVNTQFEKTRGKSKPGTATVINGQNWTLRRKVALPTINMNNPHNMWTDRNQTLIYQTQWFDSKLAVFDRVTGRLIDNISVGESPSHVMTRVDTDQLHVALNGAATPDSVVELAPLARGVQGRINIGRGAPHAHWMSHDGKLMVTPNAFSADSTQYNFSRAAVDAILPAGALPIATGMTPDSRKTYVASLLDSKITVISTETKNVVNTIDLLKIGTNYFPLDVENRGNISGPIGALPIQTPVSPDGKSMVTANTLSGTITVVDTRPNQPTTDTVVAMLPCDPGCHGVQYGAKLGGGYYAYVSSKFSNGLIIVDPDPNGTGNPAEAKIVGRISLAGAAASDDTVTGNLGMGGQGLLTIPVVYNGWVQQWVEKCASTDCNTWKSQLTSTQKNP